MADDTITDTTLHEIDALVIEAAEQRALGTPLYVTEDAIDRNPWAAAILDLPKDASKELLERVIERTPLLTAAAIAENPFNAVHLDLPPDANRELLTLIATTAGGLALSLIECQHALVEGRPVNLADVPDSLRDHVEQFPDLLTLNEMGELARKVLARQQEAGERVLQIDEVVDLQSLHNAEDSEAQEPREVVTVEAIARDPWNAVFMDLPKQPSAELALLIRETAYELRNQLTAENFNGISELPLDELNWRLDLAGQRREDAWKLYDKALVSEAWQAREFSHRTIDGDPWTSVYLAVPENADRELLERALGCAAELKRVVDEGDARDAALGPAVNRDSYTREQNSTAATARLALLDTRLEAARAVDSIGEKQAAAKISEGRWYFEWETGHIRQDGTDVIIATMANNAHLIGEDEQIANAYAIASVPKLIEALSRGQGAIPDKREEFGWNDLRDSWWGVVDKAIPETTDVELLKAAHRVACFCAEAANRDMMGPPGSVFLVEHIEKRFDAAMARVIELRARLDNPTQHVAIQHDVARPYVSVEESKPITMDNTPFTEQDLYRDPWSAVYRPIPPEADQTVLELAHLAAGRCQAAVAGYDREPGPAANNAFSPFDLGKDATPQENFERANARLAELEERIAQGQSQQTATPQPEQDFKQAEVNSPHDDRLTAATAAVAHEQQPAVPLPQDRGLAAVVSAMLEGLGNYFSGLIHGLADMISASPPPTLEQAEGMVRVAAEQRQATAFAHHLEQRQARDDEFRAEYEQSRYHGMEPEETLMPDERQSQSQGMRR